MESKIGYAPIHGLQMYYEIMAPRTRAAASGAVHGGGDTIQTSLPRTELRRDRSRRLEQQVRHTADIAGSPVILCSRRMTLRRSWTISRSTRPSLRFSNGGQSAGSGDPASAVVPRWCGIAARH